MRPLWPCSLGGRLVLALVVALAAVQAVLVFVLHDEQRALLAAMAHGQALNQTAALARLLSTHPQSDTEGLIAAFGSRTACAQLVETRPVASAPPLSPAEAQLSAVLRQMLQGDVTGAPRVTVEPSDIGERICSDDPRTVAPGGRGEARAPSVHVGFYAAEAAVPLKDGRTLLFRTIVEGPPQTSWIALAAFALASLVVAVVVIVAVRHETRALRDLTAAAERLGRGEVGPPLPVGGPSEIAAAIRAFNTMQERLHRFVRERMGLLAAVSHDLRTPLTTLRLKAEFIDDEAARDDMIVTIEELTAITETTLAFTRAEVSQEETKSVDLGQLVAEVVDDFRLAGHQVEITATLSIAYGCRPVLLKRAVRNLIENAVRYGGGAHVSLCRNPDGLSIVVEDDGPGLPADRMEDAFKPFVRLEPSRSQETGGLGLGLAIARGVVQAHGGHVTMANRLEGGLRVEIQLPAQG